MVNIYLKVQRLWSVNFTVLNCVYLLLIYKKSSFCELTKRYSLANMGSFKQPKIQNALRDPNLLKGACLRKLYYVKIKRNRLIFIRFIVTFKFLRHILCIVMKYILSIVLISLCNLTFSFTLKARIFKIDFFSFCYAKRAQVGPSFFLQNRSFKFKILLRVP